MVHDGVIYMGKEEIKNVDVTSPEDIVKNDVRENAIFRMSRRRFVQMAGATAAALALGRFIDIDMMPTASAFYQSPGLDKVHPGIAWCWRSRAFR